MEYEFRASQLKDIISDPLNYYYLKNKTYQSQAMKDGTEREMLSYELFTKFIDGKLNANYQEQVEGKIDIGGCTITGHADIVGDDYVCDIKNSIRSDKDLIEEYEYQIGAYALMFNKTKGFIFVDKNEGNEMDLTKCRLITVDLKDVLNDIKEFMPGVVKALNENKEYAEQKTNEDKNDLIERYNSLQNLIKEQQKNIKAWENEQATILATLTDQVLTSGTINTPQGSVRMLLKRELKRKVTTLPGTGNYTSYVKIVKNDEHD